MQGQLPFGKAVREESGEDELTFNDDGKVDIGKSDSTAAMGSGAVIPHFSQPTWGGRPMPKQLRIVTRNEVVAGPEFCDSPTVMTPGPDLLPDTFDDGGSDTKFKALADPRKPAEIMVMGQGNDNSEGGPHQGTVIKLQAEGHGSDRRGRWMSVKERKAMGKWDGKEDGLSLD